MRLAAVSALLLVACGGTAAVDPPDAECGPVDCWDDLSCREGAVTRTFGTDSCRDLVDGDCPRTVTTCSQGCDVENADFGPDELWFEDEALCAEAPVAEVGDVCNFGAICLPTRAVLQPDGTVSQTYLACDDATNTCAETAPPVIDGWLEPCPQITSPPSPDFAGVVIESTACLVQHVAATSCLRSALTITCRGDWECPAGASCDDAIPGGYGGVCRPGARGAPIDLGC